MALATKLASSSQAACSSSSRRAAVRPVFQQATRAVGHAAVRRQQQQQRAALQVCVCGGPLPFCVRLWRQPRWQSFCEARRTPPDAH